jgi:hypothetical protein
MLLSAVSVAFALVLTPHAAMFTALLLFVGLLLARQALSARRHTREATGA